MIRTGYLGDGLGFAASFKSFLKESGSFRIIFESDHEGNVSYQIRQSKIEMLVISVNSISESALKDIRRKFPRLKIVLLSKEPASEENDYSVADLIIPLFYISPDEIINNMIGQVNNHPKSIAIASLRKRNILANVVYTDPRKKLSKREIEVIEELRKDNDRYKLADKLSILKESIDKHVSHSLHKTGYHRLEELIEAIDLYEKNSINSEI